MLLSGVIAGLVLGIAVGRDWRRIERLQIAWLPVLALALVVRAMAPFSPFAFVTYVLAIALTTAFAAANWRLPGAPFVAVGSILNLIVVLANGAMPVDVDSLAAAGGRVPNDGLHTAMSYRSNLPLLADVIIVPVVRAAYSIGDAFIALGGFLLPFVTLTRR